MNRLNKTVIFLVGLSICGASAYYWFVQKSGVALSSANEVPVDALPAPKPNPVENIPSLLPNHFPIAVEKQATSALPALDESDSSLWHSLGQTLGATALTLFFNKPNMIRNFVATVDNLPREAASINLMPVKPTTGIFKVSSKNGQLLIDTSNAKRYMPFIDALTTANPTRIFSLYKENYSLFQQAYAELGYPKGYFNDRLVVAMDDLLAAPEMERDTPLTQPNVLYEFSEQDFQQRSAGQKIMLRIGVDNERELKKTIRLYRAMAVGEGMPLSTR